MAVTLETLKKSIGKKKVKSMAFAWLADYENMAGDTSTALARVDAGLKLYPGDIPGMLVRTKILFQQGNFDECVKECERVLEREPFCLSALKRMGEAYEQLENIGERNSCYRRVHDMDPLDSFWKEEYEAVPEATGLAAVAGAVADAVADSEFAMPDMDGVVEGDAGSAEPAGEAPATEAEPVAEQAEESLFSKSLDMDIDSASADATAETATDAPATEQPKPYVSPFSAAADDDPFAALASLGSDDSLGEESTMDSLQQSLESAMGSDISEVTLDQEIQEGEEISGNDLDSAFSNFFGEEDDLDSLEGDSGSASPFAQMDLPTSLDEDADDATASDTPAGEANVEEEKLEDKPQSIDDAFGDIFGEDELPEELPASTPAPSAEQSMEIKPEEESFSGGMFEKSAAADMGLGTEDDLKLEEPEATEEKPEADKPQSLDDAFGDIFGEDELPEELPAASSTEPAPQVEDSFDISNWSPDASAPAENVQEDSALDLPAEESLDVKTDDVFEWSVDDKKPVEPAVEEETPAEVAEIAEPAVEDSSLELPVAEEVATPAEDAGLELPATEEVAAPAENAGLELPAAEEVAAPEETVAASEETAAPEESVEEGFSVDKAFDALFAEDDELPEEKATAEQPAENLADASTETPAEDALAVDVDKVNTESEEADIEKSELDKEMGAAFTSLFAEEDDLPVDEAKPEVAAASDVSQEDTGASIEEAPLEDASLESDLDKSFSSLFGEDDSLEEEKVVPSAETPVADQPAPEPEVAAENSAVDADSLESEFSGAFKQLFDTDDDSLVEKEDTPSNKGVDFLMSGDSDDEVSAGLVKDPTVPLDKMSTDLDESLNTPTLAEIYFEQGLYDKALAIYQDLARKEPENETIRKRLDEVESAFRSKFGDNANG